MVTPPQKAPSISLSDIAQQCPELLQQLKGINPVDGEYLLSELPAHVVRALKNKGLISSVAHSKQSSQDLKDMVRDCQIKQQQAQTDLMDMLKDRSIDLSAIDQSTLQKLGSVEISPDG